MPELSNLWFVLLVHSRYGAKQTPPPTIQKRKALSSFVRQHATALLARRESRRTTAAEFRERPAWSKHNVKWIGFRNGEGSKRTSSSSCLLYSQRRILNPTLFVLSKTAMSKATPSRGRVGSPLNLLVANEAGSCNWRRNHALPSLRTQETGNAIEFIMWEHSSVPSKLVFVIVNSRRESTGIGLDFWWH